MGPAAKGRQGDAALQWRGMRVIRGFVTGVVWGGVVAGVGLAVISQVAPKSMAPGGGTGVETATVVESVESPIAIAPIEAPKQAVPPVASPVVPPVVSSGTELPVEQAVAPKPAPVIADPAPPPLESSDVTALIVSPAAPDLAVLEPVPLPDLPAVNAPVIQGSTVPDTPIAPDLSKPVDSGVVNDQPPPAPVEALLEPAPTPLSEAAPARIAPEAGTAPDVATVPEVAALQPDAAPDLPVAGLPPEAVVEPVPVPDPAPASETPTEITEPPPVLEPVEPIISADAPRRLVPDAELPPAEGVKIGRLPKIGSTEPADAVIDEVPVDLPPLQLYSRAFENPDAKPLFSILLRDTGEANLDRASLAKISFPITFVLDPLQPGAAEAAKVYRSAGQEVLMLASGIPEGASPADLEQTFQSLASVLPEAVGVIDQALTGFQGNRPLAAQVVSILAAQGRGLVTFDQGLNAADQEARRAALPAAVIFRQLDANAEPPTTIRRYLDRAAFKAAQEGRVVVLGATRPETVAALLEWAVEGRAAAVALAPVTAVLGAP